MDLDLQTPQDIIEGETCGVLVSLLGHLADLVDHSASVFSGLHAEIEQVNSRCGEAQQRCSRLNDKLKASKGGKEVANLDFVVKAAEGIVPRVELPATTRKASDRIRDSKTSKDGAGEPSGMQDAARDMGHSSEPILASCSRSSYEDNCEPSAPSHPETMPSAPHAPVLSATTSRMSTESIAETLDSIRRSSQGKSRLIGEDMSTAVEQKGRRLSKGSMSASHSRQPSHLGDVQDVSLRLRFSKDGSSASHDSEKRQSAGGEMKLGKSKAELLEGMREKNGVSFTQGLEHLIAEPSRQPAGSPDRVTITENDPPPTPQSAFPILKQLSIDDELAEDLIRTRVAGRALQRQLGSAEAESVTARSCEVESPAFRKKNEELDATIMEALHVIQNLEEQQACGADLNGHRSNSNGQAEEWDSRLLGRTLTGDTIEGQIYPDSRVPLLQLHRPTVAAGIGFSPLGQGLPGMQNLLEREQQEPNPALPSHRSAEGHTVYRTIRYSGCDSPSARTVAPREQSTARSLADGVQCFAKPQEAAKSSERGHDSIVYEPTLDAEIQKDLKRPAALNLETEEAHPSLIPPLRLGLSSQQSQDFIYAPGDDNENADASNYGSHGRPEPVFMRNRGSSSPVFPPELVLPEGPLAVALPNVNRPWKPTSLKDLNPEPKWGVSRYVLPDGAKVERRTKSEIVQPSSQERPALHEKQTVSTPRVPRTRARLFPQLSKYMRTNDGSEHHSDDQEEGADKLAYEDPLPLDHAAPSTRPGLRSPSKPEEPARTFLPAALRQSHARPTLPRPVEISKALQHIEYEGFASPEGAHCYPPSAQHRRYSSASDASTFSMPSMSTATFSMGEDEHYQQPTLSTVAVNPTGVFPRRFGLAPYSTRLPTF